MDCACNADLVPTTEAGVELLAAVLLIVTAALAGESITGCCWLMEVCCSTACSACCMAPCNQDKDI